VVQTDDFHEEVHGDLDLLLHFGHDLRVAHCEDAAEEKR
jgi:hypothetical protein